MHQKDESKKVKVLSNKHYNNDLSIIAKLFLFYLSEEVLTSVFFYLGVGDIPTVSLGKALLPIVARDEMRIYLRLGLHSHMTPLICYVLYICRTQFSNNKCLNKPGKILLQWQG